MYRKSKKLTVWCVVICFVIIVQLLLTYTASAQSSEAHRIFGIDRYKTAVSISQEGWVNSEYAILARGDDFSDALCAGPLAKKLDAPILLTEPEGLNAYTLNELKRLGARRIIIAGGTGAVSEATENALKAEGFTSIERVYGDDRYETSVKFADKLGNSSKVVLATGSDFADALSISVPASKLGMPILLTNRDSLPDKVKRYLSGGQISTCYVIGGHAVISDSVKREVPGPIRLGGANRYETNVEVLREFEGELSFDIVYAAVGDGPQGDEFADALAGSVLAARTSSPLLLTDKALPYVTGDFLEDKFKEGSRAIALGGEGAVPSSVINSILGREEPAPVIDEPDIEDGHPKVFPVLIYHYFSQMRTDNDLVMPIKKFKEHMMFLKNNNYTTVTMDEVYSHFVNGTHLPEKPILITIDDGSDTVYEFAYPVLKELKIKATVFAITGYADKRRSHLTSEQMIELQESGIDIESHTVEHEKLDDITYEEQYNTLRSSKIYLENLLNKEVKYLAYPYGTFNELTIKAMKALGYKMAFSGKRGLAKESNGIFDIHRLYIGENDTMETFISLVDGTYDYKYD